MTTSERVFEYLKGQGLAPERRDSGNIVFKYEMLTFLFVAFDDDEQFFDLTLPGIYDVDDENCMDVFEAINEVNETTKVVKLTISGDEVWCCAEIMLDSTPELDDLIPRLVGILTKSRLKFYNYIENN